MTNILSESRVSNNPDAPFLLSDDSIYTEAVVQGCSLNEMFFEISQNPLENTWARVSFLIKLQGWALQLY